MRILLLYVSAVSGHRRAAEAIAEAFHKFYPEVEVRQENLFQHGNSFIRCLLDSFYYAIIKLTPWLWDLIWDSQTVYWLTYGIRNLLYQLNYHRLYREVIYPYQPQAVICTHNIACALCSLIKRQKKMNFLLTSVPTDFSLHPYWYYPAVNLYLIPHEGMRAKLIKQGAKDNQIKSTGIPVSFGFGRQENQKKLRREWGLDPDLFTILLMGGALGLGPIEKIVYTLSDMNLSLQLLVVTGINRHLKRKLEQLQSRINFPLRIWGFVNEIDQLMGVSNLLISKPGGLTTAEALSKAVPMGIVDSLAGQERRNRELLLERGVAFDLREGREIARLVARLSDGSFDWEDWKKKVRELARPQASWEITRQVIMNLKKKGINVKSPSFQKV